MTVARADFRIAFRIDELLDDVERVAPVTVLGDELEELRQQQVVARLVGERLAIHVARGESIAELAVAIADRCEPCRRSAPSRR